MTNQESHSSRLICIIEGSTMVYAIVQNGTIIMSDLWKILDGNNLFHNPQLVTAFLRKLAETHEFSEVTFGMIHPNFTLYPTASYTSENEKLWLKGIREIGDDYTCFTNHLDDKISNTFCIPKRFAIEVRYHFPTCNFIHVNSASLQQFVNQTETCVVSHSINGYQLVNVFQEGMLICSNLYPCENEDCKLYYSMLPYQMFDLDRNIVPMYINEVVQNNTILYEKLNTYLQHIHVNELPQSIDHEDIKNHNYLYSIYCISKCA